LNLSGNKYELTWLDFTAAPLRGARSNLRKVFRAKAPFSLQIRAFLRCLSAKNRRCIGFWCKFLAETRGVASKM